LVTKAGFLRWGWAPSAQSYQCLLLLLLHDAAAACLKSFQHLMITYDTKYDVIRHIQQYNLFDIQHRRDINENTLLCT
jgi:hypothetical protein